MENNQKVINNDKKINMIITHLNGDKVNNNNKKIEENKIQENKIQEKEKNIENHTNQETKQKKKKPKKNKIYKNKCNCIISGKICKKKLSLTEQITNKCRCGLVFCSKHKGNGFHKCTFDYKGQLFNHNVIGGGKFKCLEVI
jgi:hypothetical protein